MKGTSSSSEANPLLIKGRKQERKKRGNVEEEEEVRFYWLLHSQKRRLQSYATTNQVNGNRETLQGSDW